jgi:hypothetical protein
MLAMLRRLLTALLFYRPLADVKGKPKGIAAGNN